MIQLDNEDEQSSSLQDAMTPMIDVIFVLIAFMMLMINAPLVTMEVELPKAVEKPNWVKVDGNVVTITVVNDEKSWQVNKIKVSSIAELKSLLEKKKKEFPKKLTLVIHSDKKVPMERIVVLFSTLQALNLNVSHLALQE